MMRTPHTPRLVFDGPPDDASRTPRLTQQHAAIRALMLDEQWRTLEAIAQAVAAPPASVSAQLRHLRKPRFGGFQVEKRHRGRGLYEYRVRRRLVDGLAPLTERMNA